MTKDEKDSVDLETTQTDVPVDSQPRVEHEGLQNQPPVNLPQLSAQSEADSSQARSGGHAEININIIEEEKNEELSDQTSTAVESSSTETESLSISARIKICRKKITEHLWLYLDRLINDCPVFFSCITLTFFSLLFGLYTFKEYSDFFMTTLCISIVTLLLPCVERAAGLSLLRKYMRKRMKEDEVENELPCPCGSKNCNHGKSSRSRSRSRRRVPREKTKFEHEVADPSSGKVPEIHYVDEDTENSQSTEPPVYPTVVDADVYSNVESSGCSGETSVIPTTSDTGARSKDTPFRPRPPSPSSSE